MIAQVEETGTGPWVCFCWCNPIYERHRFADEASALLHRCRLGCRRWHLILRQSDCRGIFSFTLENE